MDPTDSEPSGRTFACPIQDHQQRDGQNSRHFDVPDGTITQVPDVSRHGRFPNWGPSSLPSTHTHREVSSPPRSFGYCEDVIETDSVSVPHDVPSLSQYPTERGSTFSHSSSSIPSDIPDVVTEVAQSAEFSDGYSSGVSLPGASKQDTSVSSDAARTEPNNCDISNHSSLDGVTLPEGKVQLPLAVDRDTGSLTIHDEGNSKVLKAPDFDKGLGLNEGEERIESLTKSFENTQLKNIDAQETDIKVPEENDSPSESIHLIPQDDACVDSKTLGLQLRSEQSLSAPESINSLKGQEGSLPNNGSTKCLSLNISTSEVFWDSTYKNLPKLLNRFWIPARGLNEREEFEFYRKLYPLSIKRQLEADTRNLALKSLFAKLHETNQRYLIQSQQLKEIKIEFDLTKQSLHHMAQLMKQKLLTFSDVLFIFLIDTSTQSHQPPKGNGNMSNAEPVVPDKSENSDRKSTFLSKLESDWSLSIKGNDDEKITVGELLKDLGVAMTDAKAVGSLMLNLVQEVVRLKQTMSEQTAEKFGESVGVYLEAQQYEEVIASLKNQISQLEYALETLRTVLFSQKHGHHDTLIHIIYDLQEKQAKQDKVLSTEMEMNRGFQHTIDKLSGEKESLEKKIQELAKKIIVKQQKESNTVEEKEASSLDENKRDEEIKQLESKVAMLYKTHSEEREALQKEINDLSDQLKRSEMQKSHAQELHKELQKRYQQITDTKTQYAETFPAILRDLRMQKAGLEEKISFLQRDVNRLEDQNGMKDAQLAWAEKEIANVKAEAEKGSMAQAQMLSRYKQESALMQQQMKQWETQVTAMSKMLSQEQKEKQKYMNMLSQLQSQAPLIRARVEQPHSLMGYPHWRIKQPMREVVTADSGPARLPKESVSVTRNVQPNARFICSKCFKSNFVDQADYEQHFPTCDGSPKY